MAGHICPDRPRTSGLRLRYEGRTIALGRRRYIVATASSTRDIIVIGGSAGALDALRTLLRGVPADIPASLFVVMHVGRVSVLASVLGRASALPVVPAE